MIAVALAAAGATPAAGSTISLSGSTYLFDAINGEINDLAISVSPANATRFRFTQPGGPVVTPQSGSGCVVIDVNTADCPMAPVNKIDIDAFDLDDGINAAAGLDVAFDIDGGLGNDQLEGASLSDTLRGGSGGAETRMEGEGGDDLIIPGDGLDTGINGGSGTDTISYNDGRGAGVVVDLQSGAPGTPGTGIGGDSDAFVSIENATGTNLADNITGSTVANVLQGLGLEDLISGDAGNDTIDGGSDQDPALNGGDGNDLLIGGSGTVQDTFNGGNDLDTVSYAARSDQIITSLTPGDPREDGDNYTLVENLEGGFNPAGDILTGDAGKNVLTGNNGPDTLIGGADADTLNGGDALGDDDAFADTASYEERNTTVISDIAGAKQDLDSYDDIQHLTGGGGDDVLRGDALANTLTGLGGSDTLIGAGGLDTVRGGFANGQADTATDVASYADRVVVVNATLGGANPDGDVYVDIQGLEGGTNSDVLTGDGGPNTLRGGSGNDTLIGAGGLDTLNGEGGTDTASYQERGTVVVASLLTGANPDNDDYISIEGLRGGTNNDTLTGNDAANTLDGFTGSDLLIGGPLNDVLVGDGAGFDSVSYQDGRGGGITLSLPGTRPDGDTYTNIDRIVGSDNNDSMTGDATPNQLEGAGGIDTINGGDGADILRGGQGGDIIDGQGGNDPTLEGGEDNDTIAGGLGNDTLRGENGNDDLDGGDGDDPVLDGGAGSDDILGGPGNDVGIDGGVGDDLLVPGGGDDGLVQGGGDVAGDTVSYDDGRAEGVTVVLNDANPDGGPGDGAELTVGIENVAGTAFADALTGDGTANTLAGGAGGDQLSGLGGGDTLAGGEDGDTLAGGESGDALAGGPGADDLDGGSGDDQLNGGTENDTLAGGSESDNLAGAPGDDVLRGGAGADVLAGGEGTDEVTYSERAAGVVVTLDGGAVANDGSDEDGPAGSRDTVSDAERVIGGAGNDTLTGSGANEAIVGGAGGDSIDGGGGTDTTTYAGHPDAVTVTLGDGAGDDGSAFDGTAGARDTVTGIETVVGSALGDLLVGDAGPNTLNGGDGDDVLRGKAGADTLNGGNGTDTASYSDRGAAEGIAAILDGATNDGAGGEGDGIAADVENAEGGAGDDILTGDGNANLLSGGGGKDTLTGGLGTDNLQAGDGDDVVKAQDGVVDTVACGAGADQADVDAVDLVSECETTGAARVVIDRDGDGIEAAADCNDANPAIKPGALEIVGNSVDENCDGVVAPFPLIGAGITNNSITRGSTTVLTSLFVSRLPAGSTVLVTCKTKKRGQQRKACPFARRTFNIAAARAKLDLTRFFRKRKLPVGTVVVVTVTAPDTIGKRLRLTMRRKKAPTKRVTCIAPGGGTVSCT